MGEFSGFSHTGGRIIRVDFGWANFSHLKNSGRIFTRRWANFSHIGGRIFRVDFGWANFSHLKNSGRIFTSVGEFVTRGWANFQGSHTLLGELSVSILGGRIFHISKIVGEF